MEGRCLQGLSASVSPGSAGQVSAPGPSCPPARAVAAAGSRVLLVIVKCFGNQHLEERSSARRSLIKALRPHPSTPLQSPPLSLLRKKKKCKCNNDFQNSNNKKKAKMDSRGWGAKKLSESRWDWRNIGALFLR